MSRRAAADFAQAQQLRGDEFDGLPVPLVGKQVLGFRQKPSLEAFSPTFSRALLGQAADVKLIAGGGVPRVVAGKACLRSDASKGDQDLALQPILRGPKHRFAKLTQAQMVA